MSADKGRCIVELEHAFLTGTVSLYCSCGLEMKGLTMAEGQEARAAHLDGFKPCGCRIGTTDRDCPDCSDGEVIR